MNRGQVLLFVILFTAVAGVLASVLAVQWQSMSATDVLVRDTDSALYLAEAGLERAKAELLLDVNLVMSSPTYTDIDPGPGNGLTYEYQFDISTSGTTKHVVSYGTVRDAAGNLRAQRCLSADLSGLKHTAGPGTQDSNKNNNGQSNYGES